MNELEHVREDEGIVCGAKEDKRGGRSEQVQIKRIKRWCPEWYDVGVAERESEVEKSGEGGGGCGGAYITSQLSTEWEKRDRYLRRRQWADGGARGHNRTRSDNRPKSN